MARLRELLVGLCIGLPTAAAAQTQEQCNALAAAGNYAAGIACMQHLSQPQPQPQPQPGLQPQAGTPTQDQCNAIAARGDYAGALACSQRVAAQMNDQVAALQSRMVFGAMGDPDCWAMFRQARAQRQANDYPSFAYLWLATRHFTPEGLAIFGADEANNGRKEAAALGDLRQSEAETGWALTQNWDHYYSNLQESGRGLLGNGTYQDPTTGQPIQLHYVGPPGRFVDPTTQQTIERDVHGDFYLIQPNGQRLAMTPVR